MRIALVADSHLSPRAPGCVGNWRAAAAAVAAAPPELSIHLGDVTLDGEARPEDVEFAAGLARAWPTPMVFVAGNHDVGPGCGEAPLAAPALARFRAAFGPDYWVRHGQRWALVGLNAQLLGSGSEQERQCFAWLEGGAIAGADQVALFLHRPLVRPAVDAGASAGRYVPAEAARRLLDGPLRGRLRLVASGHVHQTLDFHADGVRHLWLPSCGFVVCEAVRPAVGLSEIGIGWLELGDSGAVYQVRMPPGAQRLEWVGPGEQGRPRLELRSPAPP